MISNEAVMEYIGKQVAAGKCLDDLFQKRSSDGLAGGQFTAYVTLAELGKSLTSFMTDMSAMLSPLLFQWSRARKSRVQCILIVRRILKHINACTTSGFGPYKKKRFVEFVVVVGIGGVWGHY